MCTTTASYYTTSDLIRHTSSLRSGSLAVVVLRSNFKLQTVMDGRNVVVQLDEISKMKFWKEKREKREKKRPNRARTHQLLSTGSLLALLSPLSFFIKSHQTSNIHTSDPHELLGHV